MNAFPRAGIALCGLLIGLLCLTSGAGGPPTGLDRKLDRKPVTTANIEHPEQAAPVVKKPVLVSPKMAVPVFEKTVRETSRHEVSHRETPVFDKEHIERFSQPTSNSKLLTTFPHKRIYQGMPYRGPGESRNFYRGTRDYTATPGLALRNNQDLNLRRMSIINSNRWEAESER